MHTDLGHNVTKLLTNHAELDALIHSAQFDQFDPETQMNLVKLQEQVDAIMKGINKQIDAIDLKIAEMFCSLHL